MIATIKTASVVGIDGVLIDTEVDAMSRGLPTFTIVGLPSKSIDEAKERVRSAIINSGFTMPEARLTINLAPADLPKEGSHFDLPLAVGILTAQGYIEKNRLDGALFLGELSLEGKLRSVQGAVPMAIMASERGFKELYLPEENIYEVASVEHITVYPVRTLTQLVYHLIGREAITPCSPSQPTTTAQMHEFDFAHIKGQEYGKRALTIAAAGLHNIHLKGVPGAGKTMLSRALPSILPPLTPTERREVTKIYSVAGLLKNKPFVEHRPFRSPHHTTSRNGLVGGGTRPTPGEITLAHRGVLFMDEFPEFPRGHLEALRQPLEDGVVTISRAQGSLTFPARFLLLAASNPCPCGYLGHPKKPCVCSQSAILKYQKRLSGPILDRIDIHVHVQPVEQKELLEGKSSETSARVQQRVVTAWERQQERFKGSAIVSNAAMTSSDIQTYVTLQEDAKTLLKQAIERFALSARSFNKVIKVAQTIADLEAANTIKPAFIAEALQYRPKE